MINNFKVAYEEFMSQYGRAAIVTRVSVSRNGYQVLFRVFV